ncbi:hypothetical protein CQW23_34424 [Capsicum baccatum]|uniref:Pentatricopeptide repeat-containing protein n=1 Tax=Capsicum baccatum TaxID=33114 RepID=A0A2G2UZ08_CAPBA|nr:hypothetical protein CQW23_34424 [Capsicum baccatum]
MLASKVSILLGKRLSINQTKQTHAAILVNGLYDLESSLVRQIIDSTSSHSYNTSHYIKLILNHVRNIDVFSVASTIRFFSRNCQFREAVNLYGELQRCGLSPSTFSVSSALKACARIPYRSGGILIHAQVYKYGFCNAVHVQTALVDFYSKVGNMDFAQSVFDEMVEKNIVSWNSVLGGYVKSGDLKMAQSVFDEMPEKDVISWNCMVAELARSFFEAMDQKNSVSYIVLISGYSKCGDVESAEELFGQLRRKDRLEYNAMIACYAQNSRAKEALRLFNEMLRLDLLPDGMTLASAISACSQLGDLKFGSWIESFIRGTGIQMDDYLATSLIDLYAKCGSIDKAYNLFHGLIKKDLVAYTAMILGCGINGRANDAIELFDEMMNAEINPNIVTITGILTAYSHIGMVEEAYLCFISLQKYGLSPSVDHYAIVVDVLSRAGRLEEAHGLIKGMSNQPHAGVWGALLLGCSLHNNLELGEIAAAHCIELEPDSSGYRSLLANIYASSGRWDDAERLRKGVEETGYNKLPGCSWIEEAKA